jgi:prepilin-type N-terminal cleavage/methylation domain-containing protein/prepilin-type processing-associated H-X9-DG protein
MKTTPCPVQGFTLVELLVVIAIIGILVTVRLPALTRAKVNSRQTTCLNNQRQVGMALLMYVQEFKAYPGDYSPIQNRYVWMDRLFPFAGGKRAAFCCPAAAPEAFWDTNLNKTLGVAADPWAVTPQSRFSMAYNDWGISINANPQLGLGGDVDGAWYLGLVKDTIIVSPPNMIAIGCSQAQKINPTWEANLDPTQRDQWPSSRHEGRTDLLFADGHAERSWRKDVVNPQNTFWRSRWNNDHNPHWEVANWPYNATDAAGQP